MKCFFYRKIILLKIYLMKRVLWNLLFRIFNSKFYFFWVKLKNPIYKHHFGWLFVFNWEFSSIFKWLKAFSIWFRPFRFSNSVLKRFSSFFNSLTRHIASDPSLQHWETACCSSWDILLSRLFDCSIYLSSGIYNVYWVCFGMYFVHTTFEFYKWKFVRIKYIN